MLKNIKYCVKLMADIQYYPAVFVCKLDDLKYFEDLCENKKNRYFGFYEFTIRFLNKEIYKKSEELMKSIHEKIIKYNTFLNASKDNFKEEIFDIKKDQDISDALPYSLIKTLHKYAGFIMNNDLYIYYFKYNEKTAEKELKIIIEDIKKCISFVFPSVDIDKNIHEHGIYMFSEKDFE